MIDRRCIGFRTPEFDVEVEKGRLRQFARAIGETDPVYLDESAARAAGHASLPVPPTFLFCLEMERDDPYDWFTALDIPLGRVLHGEQRFVYRRIACAGEVLHFAGEVVDLYEKKGGALEFLIQRNWITDVAGAAVAEFDRCIVIRHG